MKDDFASGNPNNPKTSNLNPGRSTGSLEQLPSTKKRDLRTGSLSPAQTHPSLNVENPQEPPREAVAAPPEPAPPIVKPVEPVKPPVEAVKPVEPVKLAEPVVRVEPEPKASPIFTGAEKTSEIEMGRVTTNHQVIKDPLPLPLPLPTPAPVRPTVPATATVWSVAPATPPPTATPIVRAIPTHARLRRTPVAAAMTARR